MAAVAESHRAILDQVDESKRADLEQLHALITSIVPDWEQWVTKGIMAWGRFSYQGKTKSCAGEWMHIGLSANKSGFSLYVIPTDTDLMLPEQFKDRLGKASIGRSCVRTSAVKKLDLAEVEVMLRQAKELVDTGKSRTWAG